MSSTDTILRVGMPGLGVSKCSNLRLTQSLRSGGSSIPCPALSRSSSLHKVVYMPVKPVSTCSKHTVLLLPLSRM